MLRPNSAAFRVVSSGKPDIVIPGGTFSSCSITGPVKFCLTTEIVRKRLLFGNRVNEGMVGRRVKADWV